MVFLVSRVYRKKNIKNNAAIAANRCNCLIFRCRSSGNNVFFIAALLPLLPHVILEA